jgi:hypothetical protein
VGRLGKDRAGAKRHPLLAAGSTRTHSSGGSSFATATRKLAPTAVPLTLLSNLSILLGGADQMLACADIATARAGSAVARLDFCIDRNAATSRVLSESCEMDELQHCHAVVALVVPLCWYCDSEPIGPFAGAAIPS